MYKNRSVDDSGKSIEWYSWMSCSINWVFLEFNDIQDLIMEDACL